MKVSVYKVCLAVIYLVSAGAVVVLLLDGRSYYLTPVIERPRHPDYWSLKPGGSTGLLYGIIGASMMTAMLLYSLRKRVRLLRSLGGLRFWLDFHIYCGIYGPALIVLHSSFKVHGLVALSFWSMVTVALSGFVGRYLFVQFPRARSGDELSLAEIERVSGRLSARLQEHFHIPVQVLEEVDRRALERARPGAGLLSTLIHLPLGGVLLRRDLRRLRHSLPRLPRSTVRALFRVMRQKALLQRRIYLWDRLHRLFHYWHVAHKPFSIVMYIFMLVHIAVALSTGYGWVVLP